MKDTGTECQRSAIQVGGQAVIEGVMMRAPERISVAVRREDGEIVVRQRPFLPIVRRYRFLNLPIVRGAINLVEMLYLGVWALTFSADIAAAEEEVSADRTTMGEHTQVPLNAEEKQDGGNTLWLVLTVAMGGLLAVLLFFYLPLVLTDLLDIKQGYLFNLVDGLIRLGILFAYLASVSLWGSMRRIFEYHGAEHKSIFAFERGEELTRANARKYPTHHPRCGTSFLLIVVVVSILVFIFVGRPVTLTDRLIRLAYVPLIAGISYELVKLSGKAGGSSLTRILVVPGLFLQRITTKEPDEEQLQVALVALRSSLGEDEVIHARQQSPGR